jgi:hypothetical protein
VLGGEIGIYPVSDLFRPLISGLKTDQLAILHVLYSPISHCLIAVGSGITVLAGKKLI